MGLGGKMTPMNAVLISYSAMLVVGLVGWVLVELRHELCVKKELQKLKGWLNGNDD